MASIRRAFTDEFKAEAVRLVTVEGHPARVVPEGWWKLPIERSPECEVHRIRPLGQAVRRRARHARCPSRPPGAG